MHLVRLDERVEAHDPPFEEVRDAARREWLHARKVAHQRRILREAGAATSSGSRAAPEPADAAKVAEVAPDPFCSPRYWLLLAVGVGQAQAHDMRPAYLALTETAPGHLFRPSGKRRPWWAARLAIYPRLPRKRGRGLAARRRFPRRRLCRAVDSPRRPAGSPARPSLSTAFPPAARTCWYASKG